MFAVPDDVLRAIPISEQELRQDVAILLYQKGLPPGKAAAVAGMDRVSFRHLLASRRIPVQYDVEDLEQDVATLRSLEPHATVILVPPLPPREEAGSACPLLVRHFIVDQHGGIFPPVLAGRQTAEGLELPVEIGQGTISGIESNLTDVHVFLDQELAGVPDPQLGDELGERLVGPLLEIPAERRTRHAGDLCNVVQADRFGEVPHHVRDHVFHALLIGRA